jgi:hypothetical protein
MQYSIDATVSILTFYTAFCRNLLLTVFSRLLEFFKEVNILGSIVYPARVTNIQTAAPKLNFMCTLYTSAHCSMYLVYSVGRLGRALLSLSLGLLR